MGRNETNHEEDLLLKAARPSLDRIRKDRERVPVHLAPVLAYLEEHLFTQDLDVNRLKLACGIRNGAFAIQFSREVGASPKTYIAERRLETAEVLLTGTDLKVWRISALVGYSTLQVFSRAFLRWTGLRPSFYRTIRRSGEDGPVFTSEFLRQAVGGTLSASNAQSLIRHLLSQYPLSLQILD